MNIDSAKRKRVLWGALTLVVVVVAARWAWRSYRPEDVTKSYLTAPAMRRDMASYVTATGNLSPVVEVQVGSLVSGRIKELYADYNSEVKVGQIMATIDPQLFETAVGQARGRLRSGQASLARAKALLVPAKLEYDRLASLASSGVVSASDEDRAQADWLAAKAAVRAAHAEILEARANLDQSIVNLTYTTIRSPIDGIVVSRNVDVGQVVAASLQAPTLFVIAGDLRNMEVHTSVAESDVGQLEPGGRAEFFVDAYPNETFQGFIKEVRYEPVTVSNVVTYDALVAVQNRELKLRPGMTANVNFIVEEVRNTLAIPSRALRFQPSEAHLSVADVEVGAGVVLEENHRRRRTVSRLRNGKPELVSIVVGLSDGTDVEVVAGPLREGDSIIVAEGKGGAQPSAPERRRGPPRVF